MSELFKDICTELNNVAQALEQSAKQNKSNPLAREGRYSQITVQELIIRVHYLIDKIEKHKPITIDDVTPFKAIPAKLRHTVNSDIPHCFLDSHYLLVYLQTMEHIEHLLEPLFSWEAIADKNLMPKKVKQ